MTRLAAGTAKVWILLWGVGAGTVATACSSMGSHGPTSAELLGYSVTMGIAGLLAAIADVSLLRRVLPGGSHPGRTALERGAISGTAAGLLVMVTITLVVNGSVRPRDWVMGLALFGGWGFLLGVASAGLAYRTHREELSVTARAAEPHNDR
jgi:hypothetical protein